MILHVPLRREGLVAARLRASVQVLLVVNAQVDGQVRLLSEGLSTARPGACEGLGALVEHNVGSQANGAGETC